MQKICIFVVFLIFNVESVSKEYFLIFRIYNQRLPIVA
jgi:hypothetical protein